MAARLLVCAVLAISQVTGNNFAVQGGPQYNTQPAPQYFQAPPTNGQVTNIRQQQQQVPNGGYQQQLQLSQINGRPIQSPTASQQFPATNGNQAQVSQIKTVTEERYNNAAPQFMSGASQQLAGSRPQNQWASSQNQIVQRPQLPATNDFNQQLAGSRPQNQWASSQNQIVQRPQLPATNQGFGQTPNSNFDGGFNNAAPQFTSGASQQFASSRPQTQWASSQNQIVQRPQLPATNDFNQQQGFNQQPSRVQNQGGFNQLQGLNQEPSRVQNPGGFNQLQGFNQEPGRVQNQGGFNQLQSFNQQPSRVQNPGGFNQLQGFNQEPSRVQNPGGFNQQQGFSQQTSSWSGQPNALSNIQSRPQLSNQVGSNPTFTPPNNQWTPQAAPGNNAVRLSQAAATNTANVQQGQGPSNQIDIVQEYNTNGEWNTLKQQTQQAPLQNRVPSSQVTTQQWTQVANSQPSIARKYRPSKSSNSKRSRKPKPEVVAVTETPTPEVSTEATLTASEEKIE